MYDDTLGLQPEEGRLPHKIMVTTYSDPPEERLPHKIMVTTYSDPPEDS